MKGKKYSKRGKHKFWEEGQTAVPTATVASPGAQPLGVFTGGISELWHQVEAPGLRPSIKVLAK